MTVSLPTVNILNLRGWISFSHRFISPVRRDSPETNIKWRLIKSLLKIIKLLLIDFKSKGIRSQCVMLTD